MSPVGAIFALFPRKTGKELLHPRPPPIVERVETLRAQWGKGGVGGVGRRKTGPIGYRARSGRLA